MKRQLFSNGLVALTLLMAAVGTACGGVQDDFNDGNDSGWTRYVPLAPFGAGGTFSFPSGGYRIQAPPSPNLAALGPGRAGSFRSDATLDDFLVTVDLVAWDDTLDQAFGLAARVREAGLGTTDGYTLSYLPPASFPPGVLLLQRVDNEGLFALAGENISLDPSRGHRLVFSGKGPEFTGQVFDLSDLGTPLATVMATDATYTSGFVGLLARGAALGGAVNSAADATFDNFIARVPEPSAILLLATGGLCVAAFGRRGTAAAISRIHFRR